MAYFNEVSNYLAEFIQEHLRASLQITEYNSIQMTFIFKWTFVIQVIKDFISFR